MFERPPVRRSGDNVWRPSVVNRVAHLLLGVLFLAATIWLALTGPLSTKDVITFSLGDLLALVGVPIVLFRWRLVLEPDSLTFVFIRVRRLPVRDIVDVKCVAKRGLVFVCQDGTEESFLAVANSAWGHRRRHATRADLVARTVLSAAATARGEAPPVDFRLAPMTGLKRAALEGGLAAFVIGMLLGD